ncbi:MAG: hypothetical protein H6868_09610 [Rhodospirillales bacterium]|nr:hypothetical protein [Rhodospirillales bacterium]
MTDDAIHKDNKKWNDFLNKQFKQEGDAPAQPADANQGTAQPDAVHQPAPVQKPE